MTKATRELVATHGIADAVIAKQRRRATRQPPNPKKPLKMDCGGPLSGPTHGYRTAVNSGGTPTGGVSIDWLSSRWPLPCLLTAKLIDWRNRWSRL